MMQPKASIFHTLDRNRQLVPNGREAEAVIAGAIETYGAPTNAYADVSGNIIIEFPRMGITANISGVSMEEAEWWAGEIKLQIMREAEASFIGRPSPLVALCEPLGDVK